MKISLHTFVRFISKFLHLRRMEEKNQLLDYTRFNPQKTLIVDIDGTILFAENRDYEHAVPFEAVIEKLNNLHKNGWAIIYFTARGQLSKNGDMNRIERENRPVLEKWLKDHNVEYDYLLFNKPYGAWYVDDKALDLDQFMNKNFSE